MWADKIIKQNSPNNILWRLFRIEAERQSLPTEMPGGMRKLLLDIGKRKSLRSSEMGGEDNEK